MVNKSSGVMKATLGEDMVITGVTLSEFRRIPRSKKKRIIKKWRNNPRNWADIPMPKTDDGGWATGTKSYHDDTGFVNSLAG